MRKVLDWIADKLGYQRKMDWGDFILSETQALSTLDWPPTYCSIEPYQELIIGGVVISQPLQITGSWIGDEPAPTIKGEIVNDRTRLDC